MPRSSHGFDILPLLFDRTFFTHRDHRKNADKQVLTNHQKNNRRIFENVQHQRVSTSRTEPTQRHHASRMPKFIHQSGGGKTDTLRTFYDVSLENRFKV